MESFFAPPDRLSHPQWSADVASLAGQPLVKVLLDSVDGYLVILNVCRQVVAGNEEFLEDLGFNSLDQVDGRRTGELWDCENSTRAEGGCGTSAECAHCGAVLAVLDVLETLRPSVRECHLCRIVGGRHLVRDFRVRATPLDLGGSTYVVAVFQDISSENRRQNLEKIFLHDLGNLVGTLGDYGELLALTSGDRSARMVVHLSRVVRREVEAQSILVRAEAGGVVPRRETIELEALVRDLEEILADHPSARGKTWKSVIRAKGSPRTDRTVAVRVLVNMALNAFEASGPGDEITLAVRRWKGGWRFQVANPAVLAPETARRIFERGFSTKGTPGRGLGTYAMRLLTESFLGGRVSFTSKAGEGTRFFLDLP